MRFERCPTWSLAVVLQRRLRTPTAQGRLGWWTFWCNCASVSTTPTSLTVRIPELFAHPVLVCQSLLHRIVCVKHLYLGRCVTMSSTCTWEGVCQPLVPGKVCHCQPFVPREVHHCVKHLYLGRCVSTTCTWEGVCQPLVPGKVCHCQPLVPREVRHCVKHLYLGRCVSTTCTWENVSLCHPLVPGKVCHYVNDLFLGRCVLTTCPWEGVSLCQPLVPWKVHVNHFYMGRCVVNHLYTHIHMPLVPGKACHCVKHLYLGRCVSSTCTQESVSTTCTWEGVSLCQPLVPEEEIMLLPTRDGIKGR